MEHDLETLKKIAQRVGNAPKFDLLEDEILFSLSVQGRAWIDQVPADDLNERSQFAFSDHGKKQLQ